jgi:hypothetical protein
VRMIVRCSVILLLAGVLVSSFAAPPAIGIATAQGSFRVDNSPVQGNATLFDGTTVETSSASSSLRLQAGGQMVIAAASRGQVFTDRMVLEKGEGKLAYSPHYSLEARNLRILPDSAGAEARVALREPGRVSVTAITGQVRVTTSGGLLLARLEPGRSLEFQPQAGGAAAPLAISGCVSAADRRFFLAEQTANVTFELRGDDLARFVGQRVEIMATELREAGPTGGAARAVQVSQIKRVGGGCPAAANSGAPSGKPGGMSNGTKAVIDGEVIGGGAGAIALGLTGSDTNQPTLSR